MSERPMTKAERVYRAMVAYQEGATIVEAAAAWGVESWRLNAALHAAGFRVRTPHESRKIRGSYTPRSSHYRGEIPEQILRTYPERTADEIAEIVGCSRSLVYKRLREHGLVQRRGDSIARAAEASARKRAYGCRERVERVWRLRERGLTYGQIAYMTREPMGYVTATCWRYRNRRYKWQREESDNGNA